MISNLINKNGNAVKNQFVITEFEEDGSEKITFQSYSTKICTINRMRGQQQDCIHFYNNPFEYSNTTTRAFVDFMRGFYNDENITCETLHKWIDEYCANCHATNEFDMVY